VNLAIKDTFSASEGESGTEDEDGDDEEEQTDFGGIGKSKDQEYIDEEGRETIVTVMEVDITKEGLDFRDTKDKGSGSDNDNGEAGDDSLNDKDGNPILKDADKKKEGKKSKKDKKDRDKAKKPKVKKKKFRYLNKTERGAEKAKQRAGNKAQALARRKT
jgi:ribosomal RNA-processing protein 17